MEKILKCPICNNDLIKKDKSYVCNNNHTFDLSKRGYLNLLLVNQTHSIDSGDNKEMSLARTSFLDKGYYKALNDAIICCIKKYIDNNSYILDIGCGNGYYTYNIANDLECSVIGLDISKTMINEASKKKLNNLNYVVSSSSHLPFKDNSIDVIVSCFSPLDLNEVKRVLKNNGKIIKVTPGEYHLYELKELLYDKPYLNEINKLNTDNLKIEVSTNIKNKIHIEDNIDLMNLYKMTPYYYKTSKEGTIKIESISDIDITLDFNIDVYKYL